MIPALVLTLVLQAAPAQVLAPVPISSATAPQPTYGAPISLDAAQAILSTARDVATRRGFRMAFAVVEPSGELVAFSRMDDTQYGSTHVAQRKAETAARYRLATSVMEARVLAGRTVTLANADNLPIAGGVPIVVEGRIVGAFGVSGASALEDDEVARAALGL